VAVFVALLGLIAATVFGIFTFDWQYVMLPQVSSSCPFSTGGTQIAKYWMNLSYG
jgi:hypothetical protein